MYSDRQDAALIKAGEYMELKKKLMKFILNFLKKLFYQYTYECVLFIFTLLVLKIVQIVYKIRNFNYLLLIILYFAGLGLYKLYSNILKTVKYRVIFSVLVALLISISIFIKRNFVVQYVNCLVQYYNQIQVLFYKSQETYFYQYIPFLIILVPLFIAVILYFNSKGFGNVLIVISLIYLFNLWYTTELINAKGFLLIYLTLASFTYGYSKIIKTKSKYKKNKIKVSINTNKILEYALIMSLSVGVFCYFSVKLFGIKNVFQRIGEGRLNNKEVMERSLNNRYKLSYSGYPNSSDRLGGPVELNYDRAFRIEAKDIYYLKAVSKEFYDGFRWNRTESSFDALPKSYIYLQQRFFEPSVKEKIVIYPDNLETSTLFVPNFTFNISLKNGQVGRDESGSFMVLGAEAVKNPYSVEFYKSQLGLEMFSKLYENNIPIAYDTEDNEIKTTCSKYLQLPDSITQETYSLVKKIIKDSISTADKVKAIQSYLSQNYKYSLDVSLPPENKEFVDYFLFNERKGYCTYFATATVIMCRIAGVPARYVEGFSMADKKDSEGFYEVSSDMAHAWSEILVNPKGDIWTIVDAVPEAERDQYTPSVGGANISGPNYNAGSQSSRGKQIQRIYHKFNLSKVLIYIFILLPLSTVVFLSVKMFGFLKTKKYILSCKSSVPLYYYVRKRLKTLHENKQLPEDDFQWIDKTNDTKLKEVISQLVAEVYDEFYGKKQEGKLDKLKIYNTVEESVKTTQNKFSYHLLKIL